MPTEEEILTMRRFADLAARAQEGGYYVTGPFLSPADQGLLAVCRLPIGYTLAGGYEGAERKLVVFGDEENFGYPPDIPAHFLKIAPVAPKFADALTHRDFLGSLLGLGIERDVLGDILIDGNTGYLFCLDSIAPYLRDNLTRVKHTDVTLTETEAPPAALLRLPEPMPIVAGGERLDALVAAVYKLSRAEAARLFDKELVSVNGRIAAKPSAEPKENAMIAVRGYGRFQYLGKEGDTRKGRARVIVRVWK